MESLYPTEDEMGVIENGVNWIIQTRVENPLEVIEIE